MMYPCAQEPALGVTEPCVESRCRIESQKCKEPKTIEVELESNEQEMSGVADDALAFEQLREMCSDRPKRTVFLSHSGVQKSFTWQLCEDLENVRIFPFFDRRDDCLPKGEKFPPLIVDAARKCRVAVLVLSEEFFSRSKWPMIELNEFIKAQESTNHGLKILPLFFTITMEEYEEEKRQAVWVKTWQDWAAKDSRISVEEWKHALSKIPGGINAMQYTGMKEGEVKFRKRVVKALCKLVPANVKYDVTHVQAMDLLCEPILQRLKEVEPSDKYKVRVVGLHGMGGVGKTTISKAICNEMFAEFGGKVCHVELSNKNLVELRKKVLEELTEASHSLLAKEVDNDKLAYLLKDIMKHQKVFLVLDNVWDDQSDEARMYLGCGYHDGSKVLVTSRSVDVFKKLGLHNDKECLEMPPLEEEGAIDVFHHYMRISRESIKDDSKERQIIKRCVEKCNFWKVKTTELGSEKKFAYHPLALKVLGSYFESISFETWTWERCLEQLEATKFNILKERVHPIFMVLRLGYDTLSTLEQHIFLDLALVWVSKWRCEGQHLRFEWKWLCEIYRMSEEDMEESVEVLQRKALLDNDSNVKELKYNIHDLYIEFAKAEAQEGPFEKRRFVFNKPGTSDIPYELLKYPFGSCWPSLQRICIHYSAMKCLKKTKLIYCKNVEVLDFHECNELEVLDITGMDNLRCIVVTKSERLQQWIGLEELKESLAILNLTCCTKINDLTSVHELSLLKILNISYTGVSKLPDLRKLEQLQVLNAYGCWKLLSIVGIASLTALEKLDLSKTGIFELPDLRMLKKLRVLNAYRCSNLSSIVGIANLLALEELKVSSTAISELPDLRMLKKLRVLDAHGCSNLSSIVGIANLLALEELKVSSTAISELPDLRMLKKLRVLDAHGCSNLSSVDDIASLTALKKLSVSNTRVSKFPNLKNLKQLQVLNAYGCSNLSSVDGIASLTALKKLNVWDTAIFELPDLKKLKQLQILNAYGCSNLSSVDGIASLTALEELNVFNTAISELPNLKMLKKLQVLNANKCLKLSSVDGIASLTALKQLNVSNTRISKFSNLKNLKQLQVLHVYGCPNLSSVDGIASLTALKEFNVFDTPIFELPDLRMLKKLRILNVSECSNRLSIVDIASLTALEELNVSNTAISELPNLKKLKQLRVFNAYECSNLSSVDGIAKLTALEDLDISNTAIFELLDLRMLKKLRVLHAYGCSNLSSIVGIASLPALEQLNVSNTAIFELPDLKKLKQLQILNAYGCSNLSSVDGIASLTALEELNVFNTAISELPNLNMLKKLQVLNANKCLKLSSVDGIASLTALKKLNVSNTRISKFPNLKKLKQLRVLNACRCLNLSSVVGIANLTTLKKLNVSSTAITELPDLRMLKKLRVLNVYDCLKLSSIVGIASLTALEELNVSNTRISKFPNLTNLK